MTSQMRKVVSLVCLVCLVYLAWPHAPSEPDVVEPDVEPDVEPFVVEADPYRDFMPRGAKRAVPRPPGVERAHWTEASCASWPDAPQRVPTVDATPPHRTYPQSTLDGEAVEDLVQRGLARAWGEDPPAIDLYVRAESKAMQELYWLFESVRLFWPRNLGRVILVMDPNDEANEAWLPKLKDHALLLVYERTPAIAGRILNQISYLNLDRYSDAEFVVTTDSDSPFFRPVTPDALFNRRGELIVLKSKTFQHNLFNTDQRYFTGIDDGAYGHTMVTQPVSFRVDAFRAYRESFSSCYERRVRQFMLWVPNPEGLFCWMCQLGVFLESARAPGYDFTLELGFLRFAAHVTYERYGNEDYEASVNRLFTETLCPLLNRTDCASEYSDRLMLSYAGHVFPHSKSLASMKRDVALRFGSVGRRRLLRAA